MILSISKAEETLILYISKWFGSIVCRWNGLCVYSRDRKKWNGSPFSIDQYRMDSGGQRNFTIVVNDVEKAGFHKRSSKRDGILSVQSRHRIFVISLWEEIFFLYRQPLYPAYLQSVCETFFRPVRGFTGAMKEVQEGKAIRGDVVASEDAKLISDKHFQPYVRIKTDWGYYLICLREKMVDRSLLVAADKPSFLIIRWNLWAVLHIKYEVER